MAPRVGQDDVVGPEIAVHQASAVYRGRCLGEAGRDGRHLRRCERPAVGDDLGEGRAGHERGRHPRRIGVEVGVDHRREMPGGHVPRGQHLTCQPRPPTRVAGVLVTRKRQGDGAPVLRYAEVDPPRPTESQPSDEPVAPDPTGIVGL